MKCNRGVRRGVPGLLLAIALAMGACSGDEGAAPEPEDRCEANRQAGTITFLSPFQYAASSGIIDVLAAEEQGFYEAACLDVNFEVGQSGGQNEQLVGAGRAQLASVGGPGDVLVGAAAGAKAKAIATYGNTGIITVLVKGDGPIRSPKDLEGKTFGYKGAEPPAYLAMLEREGVDRTKVRAVEVSYDPNILRTPDLDALAAYKSNEPLALERAGFPVRQLDPEDYGIETSFNTNIVNADFAEDHPTAVQDFLRATLRGWQWVDDNLDAALDIAARRSEGTYAKEAERARWQTESRLVRDNLFEGHGVGWQEKEQFTRELDLLKDTEVLEGDVDVDEVFDNSFLEAIYDADTLKEQP